MKSYQREFCEWAKRMIEGCDGLRAGNVKVVVEDRGNPRSEVEVALGKAGVLVLIATTGHSRKRGGGASTAGELGLEVTVFENPALNRRSPDAVTVTTAAEAVKDALHWRLHEGARVRYLSMTRADADEGDYRMIVAFDAFTALNGDPVKWGIGENAVWGAVTSRKVSRGGEAVFETGRDGKARFVGARDPHWLVDLTCEVAAAITENDLPALGAEFTYGGRAYRATLAELAETDEDTATVRLAGRTVG